MVLELNVEHRRVIEDTGYPGAVYRLYALVRRFEVGQKLRRQMVDFD
jgi:hypothetical protein